jgi:predicted secreted protein
MASIYGSQGVVKLGAVAVAQVRSFDVTVTQENVDSTVMGDTSKSFINTMKEWNGSLSCLWDADADAGQALLDAGDTGTIHLQPEGGTIGDTDLTGSILVTEWGISSTHDGLVELSISFQGSGDLSVTSIV